MHADICACSRICTCDLFILSFISLKVEMARLDLFVFIGRHPRICLLHNALLQLPLPPVFLAFDALKNNCIDFSCEMNRKCANHFCGE